MLICQVPISATGREGAEKKNEEFAADVLICYIDVLTTTYFTRGKRCLVFTARNKVLDKIW